MAESPKADEERPTDRRLIPGGSFEAARMHVGMEGADRDVMPSGAQSDVDYRDIPDTPEK